jgi:WD40 repeat protein
MTSKAVAVAILVALVAAPTGASRAQTFRGLNGSIAYVKDQELWAVGPDGRNAHGLTSGHFDTDPAWSPDGSTIAFARIGTGGLDIYAYTPGDDEAIALTNDPVPEHDPAWSPDGTRIAFVRSEELWTMAADGGDAHRIRGSSPRPDTFGTFDPAWAPDGRHIVFGSNTDDGNALYVQAFTIGADGSGETRLTRTPGNKFGFAWSPDGSRIAYVSDRDGGYEVYVAGADGQGERQLTTGAHTRCPPYPCTVPSFNPSWSPDGTRIVFAHDREGTTKLYSAAADGGGATALADVTGMPGLAGNPDWQPATDLTVSAARRTAPARVGLSVTVSFRLRNAGPLDAHDLELRVAVTNGARAKAAVPSGTCAGLGCEVALLPSGRTITVSVRVRPVRAGRITVSLRAASATGDANAANNTARSLVAARR